MGKLYSGGVVVSTGFKLEDETLFDDRGAIASINDLNILRAAKGLLTYVEQDGSTRIYEGDGIWSVLSKAIEVTQLPSNAAFGTFCVLKDEITNEIISNNIWNGENWVNFSAGGSSPEGGFIKNEF